MSNLAEAKKLMKKKKPTESAWIGEFKLSDSDRSVLQSHVDDAAIAKIEGLVAEHRDLIRPHLQERLTASEISKQLMQIHEQATALHGLLRNLDGYSNAQLGTEIVRANKSKVFLDVGGLSDELTTLSVLAKCAATRTPASAGAGTRKRGQRPVPDALLVSKIAAILAGFKINVQTDSQRSIFAKICQAISNSGGFDSNDVRGPIRAYLAGRM